MLGRTEGFKTEEEDVVKATFLNGKMAGFDAIVDSRTGSIRGQENSNGNGNGVVADQRDLNLLLDSEIADQEHNDSGLIQCCINEGAENDQDFEFIVGINGKETVDHKVNGEVVKAVFLNGKMAGCDETANSCTGSVTLCVQERTGNGNGVVGVQQELNHHLHPHPEIAEEEHLDGVKDQDFEFLIGKDGQEIVDEVKLGEVDEYSNQERRDAKNAVMRAAQLELEVIRLKKNVATLVMEKETVEIERRWVQASVHDLVNKFVQMSSMVMTLFEGDWEKIQEVRDICELKEEYESQVFRMEADRVAMQRQFGEVQKKNVEIKFENLSLKAHLNAEERKMQALKVHFESLISDMEGKLGAIKEAELEYSHGKTIAELGKETEIEVENKGNQSKELQEQVKHLMEESKETELKGNVLEPDLMELKAVMAEGKNQKGAIKSLREVDKTSKSPGLLHFPNLLVSVGGVITVLFLCRLLKQPKGRKI